MNAYRILLAGLGFAFATGAGVAQSPLFGTKPSEAVTIPQLPAMASLLPTAGAPQPTEILTAPASGLPTQPTIPGAVYSPWQGEGVGGNGPVTYEIYLRGGPSFVGKSGDLSGQLQTGATIQGGGRTLLFNTAGDAAWVIDIGLHHTYNQGRRLESTIDVLANELKSSDPNANFTIPLGVRHLKRTGVNVGLGRDWFFNGPGSVGCAPETNWRFGTDFGGRYGTASIGFEPLNDPDGYRRRHGIYHGVYVGSQLNYERNMGGWILLAGVRAEWSYDWTNLIPPLDGDIQSINLMFTIGVRF